MCNKCSRNHAMCAQVDYLREQHEIDRQRGCISNAWHDCETLLQHIAALQREHAASAARVVELEANAGKLPKEPPLGLLVSMALRQDHGLGVPGYYDNMPFAAVSVSHARRLQCALDSMRQVYEEVSGHGFWSPENECEYVAMHKAALAQPDAARAAGEQL
jgi:hypothetical protein